MTDDPLSSDTLPPLEGGLSRGDLLRHLSVGNVLGYVVLYDSMDAMVAEVAQIEPGGLGRYIVEACVAVNEDIPEHDMELGTDLHFHLPGKKYAKKLKKAFGEDLTLLPLTPADAEYMLGHMPRLFLGQTTEES